MIKQLYRVCKDGELYYTLEQVEFYGYGYNESWIKDVQVLTNDIR